MLSWSRLIAVSPLNRAHCACIRVWCCRPQCAGCLAGSYTRSQFTGECTPCPKNSQLVLFGYGAGAAVGGYILYRLYRKGPSVAALTIAVDYFQILALFASLQVGCAVRVCCVAGVCQCVVGVC